MVKEVISKGLGMWRHGGVLPARYFEKWTAPTPRVCASRTQASIGHLVSSSATDRVVIAFFPSWIHLRCCSSRCHRRRRTGRQDGRRVPIGSALRLRWRNPRPLRAESVFLWHILRDSTHFCQIGYTISMKNIDLQLPLFKLWSWTWIV